MSTKEVLLSLTGLFDRDNPYSAVVKLNLHNNPSPFVIAQQIYTSYINNSYVIEFSELLTAVKNLFDSNGKQQIIESRYESYILTTFTVTEELCDTYFDSVIEIYPDYLIPFEYVMVNGEHHFNTSAVFTQNAYYIEMHEHIKDVFGVTDFYQHFTKDKTQNKLVVGDLTVYRVKVESVAQLYNQVVTLRPYLNGVYDE